MKQLIINGIQIEIEKKKIKNMYLRVLPPDGRVCISAPNRMTDAEIKRFALSRLEWIEHHQTKLQDRHIDAEMKFVTGENISVWGKKYQLEIVNSGFKGKVKIEGDRLLLQVKESSTSEQRKRTLDECYREALKQEIPLLIEKWEKIIGVKANAWSIRDMKTRWGTCNIREKKICLNMQLAKKPPKCLEYVVVHELVHLLERSHNSVFKAYMSRFLPEWKAIKAELNGREQ